MNFFDTKVYNKKTFNQYNKTQEKITFLLQSENKNSLQLKMNNRYLRQVEKKSSMKCKELKMIKNNNEKS